MDCEWKSILIDSLKRNLQENNTTKRVSSFKLPVSSIQQDGKPDVRVLPFAGFVQFDSQKNEKLENQINDNPKHLEIPYFTLDDKFLPAKHILLNSILFKIDIRSDFLTNISKGSKFTEICWFMPHTKEQFRLTGTFCTIISSNINKDDKNLIGKPFCNSNLSEHHWEELRKKVWDKMPSDEKKLYLNNFPCNEYEENVSNYKYDCKAYSLDSTNENEKKYIVEENSNYSFKRKASINKNQYPNIDSASKNINDNEITQNNINFYNSSYKDLDPKPENNIKTKEKDNGLHMSDNDNNNHNLYSYTTQTNISRYELSNKVGKENNESKSNIERELYLHHSNSRTKTRTISNDDFEPFNSSNTSLNFNTKNPDNANNSDNSKNNNSLRLTKQSENSICILDNFLKERNDHENSSTVDPYISAMYYILEKKEIEHHMDMNTKKILKHSNYTNPHYVSFLDSTPSEIEKETENKLLYEIDKNNNFLSKNDSQEKSKNNNNNNETISNKDDFDHNYNFYKSYSSKTTIIKKQLPTFTKHVISNFYKNDSEIKPENGEYNLNENEIEKAYSNFCLLLVDIDCIDYLEMSYLPQKRTKFYKIEFPCFSIEDNEKCLMNEKQLHYFDNENKNNHEYLKNEKHEHKHYDNFNSIYPSMTVKYENLGFEPFTKNQIQSTSYISENNECFNKNTQKNIIYKKVHWIKNDAEV